MGGVDTFDDVERPGIGRRTLIKRAVAAGAVAWTAPMILDSLASPAAAATAAAGCYDLFYPLNGTSGACATAVPVTGCCQPTGFTTHTNFTTTGCTVSVTGNCGSNASTTVFTITSACSCVFIQGVTQTHDSSPAHTCIAGTLGGSPTGKTITFTTDRCSETTGGTPGFRMLVACGGSTLCATTRTSCNNCE